MAQKPVTEHVRNVQKKFAWEGFERAGEKKFNELSRQLGSEEWFERRAAAMGLAEYGEKALPLLSTAAKDADWAVRRVAVSGIGRLPPAKGFSRLAEAAKDKHPLVRYAAVEGLAKSKKGIPYLANALEDENPHVRNLALLKLGRSSHLLTGNKRSAVHARALKLIHPLFWKISRKPIERALKAFEPWGAGDPRVVSSAMREALEIVSGRKTVPNPKEHMQSLVNKLQKRMAPRRPAGKRR
ncbi:MAG: HEAT repeat domain-containing protein [Candidatus Micrarchaeota archaeon]|nr:HEAT repeat domain-containing protein [Candidatus Micrarchaeota archaeon]